MQKNLRLSYRDTDDQRILQFDMVRAHLFDNLKFCGLNCGKKLLFSKELDNISC